MTALPSDVGNVEWLAEQLGLAVSTAYRLAATGELARFGLFKVVASYRVSKPKALRAIHGAEEPEQFRIKQQYIRPAS